MVGKANAHAILNGVNRFERIEPQKEGLYMADEIRRMFCRLLFPRSIFSGILSERVPVHKTVSAYKMLLGTGKAPKELPHNDCRRLAMNQFLSRKKVMRHMNILTPQRILASW